MIPLRDANPTRRTPYVTLSLIVACFVVFAWELGLLASGGDTALPYNDAGAPDATALVGAFFADALS